MKRRKTSDKLALRIARAQLRAIHRSMETFVPFSPPRTGPPQFVQCWAVAGRPVTQALDSTGQVWERHWIKATATTPEQSWWEAISMERRALAKKEET